MARAQDYLKIFSEERSVFAHSPKEEDRIGEGEGGWIARGIAGICSEFLGP